MNNNIVHSNTFQKFDFLLATKQYLQKYLELAEFRPSLNNVDLTISHFNEYIKGNYASSTGPYPLCKHQPSNHNSTQYQFDDVCH